MKPPWHITMSKFGKTLYIRLGRRGSQERMAGLAFCFFLIPAFPVHNCLPQCLGYNSFFKKRFLFPMHIGWLSTYVTKGFSFVCFALFTAFGLTLWHSFPEPSAPVLKGRVFTTGPLRKSRIIHF